ncbi:MAG TPA: exodeoxyribonuclease VII large subunit [Planctomycetota bacterium]|nr:exodeoxyribonuclease VII large subunit [Planctomycetota bacterium]
MALAAESLQPSERKVLSVADLTRRIKKSIEDNVRIVWVAGEVSNFRGPGPSGHLYFTLKDAESQIPCAMWKGMANRLRFALENGMEVVALGKVDVYVPYGKYQLIVDDLEPRGVGSLQQKFEQLKEKLQKEGLFDPARKRPLPFLPRTLGIVTSPTGAAVADMVRTIRSRCSAIKVVVYPVRVQGDGSAEEIAAAIGHLNLSMPEIDVLIVGRGGGSIEDLWAFNEEVVARAIHASRIPVISAVGHETDTTIADFVADVRALTPTDGAVRAVPRQDELELALEGLDSALRRALRSQADLARSRLDGLRDGRSFGRVEELPDQLKQRLDDAKDRLDVGALQASVHLKGRLDLLQASLRSALPGLLDPRRQRVEHLTDRLRADARRSLDQGKARLSQAAASLEALSPVAILGRGYSITRLEATQEILKEADQAKAGDRIVTRLGKGRVFSKIEKTEPS